MKPRIPRPKDEPLKLITVKMTEDQFRRLKSKAKKSAEGNLSEYLRKAGLSYIPR